MFQTIQFVRTRHMTLDNLGKYYVVTYRPRKIIRKLGTKFDTKRIMLSFLAIIELFLTIENCWLSLKLLKTERHYLDGCNNKVLILIEYYNLC